MDVEERMAKAEAEIAILKEMQTEMRATIERGFSEQRAAMTEIRKAMERAFSEQRTALAEERGARERGVRWSLAISLTILALVLGIITRLIGL